VLLLKQFETTISGVLSRSRSPTAAESSGNKESLIAPESGAIAKRLDGFIVADQPRKDCLILHARYAGTDRHQEKLAFAHLWMSKFVRPLLKPWRRHTRKDQRKLLEPSIGVIGGFCKLQFIVFECGNAKVRVKMGREIAQFKFFYTQGFLAESIGGRRIAGQHNIGKNAKAPSKLSVAMRPTRAES
jgi:hypothetical protein